MQVFPTFEAELKAIDPRLTVVPNTNYPKLANIKLDGVDVCPIPSGEIKDEVDKGYTVEFANGIVSIHKTRPEALSRVDNILEMIKTPEGADNFFDR